MPSQLAGLLVPFLANVARRPFWLFLGLFCVLLVTDRFTGWSRRRWPKGVASLAAFAVLACYVGMVLWYTSLETYSDYAEPSVAAVGWLFRVGLPVYHAPDAAERYAHIYGPLAFAIPGWAVGFLGPSIPASKIPGAFAAVASVSVMHVLLRRTTNARRALTLTGLFAGVSLMFRHFSFWIRPDSSLLLVATGALAAAASRSPTWGAIGWGVATGVMVNLKMTGPLYALPALGLLVVRHGRRSALTAVLVAALISTLPFVLLDNVSWTNYMHWVRVSAGNGLQFASLRRNVEWAILLFIPLAPFLLADERPASGMREIATMALTLAGAAGAVVIAASKPGAGSYHLLPFVPSVVYLLARRRPAAESVETGRATVARLGAVAFVLAVGLVAVAEQVRLIDSIDTTPYAEDVREIIATHRGRRLEMGYSGGTERLSLVRPLVVFQSNAYLLDAPAVQEYQMSGLDLPSATVDAVERCVVELWLVPKGGDFLKPVNAYPSTGHRPLFPEEFRAAFLRAYAHVGDSRYYELWECRQSRQP